MIKPTIIILLAILSINVRLLAQTDNIHLQSSVYERPTDPLVLEKLESWQDLKFGIIIHWGIYAVPGMIESWALCSEDWITRPDSMSYCQFKEWYWGLKNEFNPVNFNPDKWARIAKDAGMRYLVFTTKHHDGFCMFDTKETNYKITAGPFKDHQKSNVAKHVFDAFRNEGFMIGAYFSKPDWHSEHYWRPQYATPDRNNNYDIRRHPDIWDKFMKFTHNQIGELLSDYGKIDILWLDGGWVRPLETVNEEVLSWGARIPEWSQDIDMPLLAANARKSQPGILIVDRTVHGPYENYQTPERRIPDQKIDYPWESCIPLGDNWGFVPGDRFKSSTAIIHNLIEIVAKGGSMLLGIGPKPDGTIGDPEIKRLAEIGVWMKVNGRAIHDTRTLDMYQNDETFFTQNKDGTINAIVRLPENIKIPKTVEWTGHVPKKNSKMTLLASGQSVGWKRKGDKIMVSLPASFTSGIKNYPALAFVFEVDE